MAIALVCSVEGCINTRLARGMCGSHYNRWRRHGDARMGNGPMTPSGVPMAYLMQHMWSACCTPWPFTASRKGYPAIWVDGRMVSAPRYVCEVVHGPQPTADHQSAHNCGKGHLGCFSAHCLEWKTPSENQRDRVVHGTSNRGERAAHVVLSAPQVLVIHKSKGVMRQQDLAVRYGVDRSTISRIQRGVDWAWLTG